MYRKLCVTLIFLAAAATAHGQAWSGIISSSRAIDWTSAGVPGGVPSAGWTQCGSTIAAYGSLAVPGDPTTIQNAINACGTNQYVKLGVGTFYLGALSSDPNNGGLLLKSNMAVRGSGADKTFVVFSNRHGCGGLFASFCVSNLNGLTYYGSPNVAPGTSNAATWTAGFSQGATSITLTNVGSATIVNGQYIYLDQKNDTADNGSFFICDNTTPACSLEGGAPGRTLGGVHANQIQMVKVVSGCAPCSGAGPFTVTITPGLYALNWRIGQTPGAWWSSQITNAGVEDMSIDNTNNGGYSGVALFNAFRCWVSGIRSLNANRNHVWFWQAGHNTVQNSYFYGTKNSASQSYGVESFIAADNLVENNIFQKVTAPVVMGPGTGEVFIYNFSRNDVYITPTWLQQAYAFGHDAGVMYNLFEGNNGSGFWADVFHGSSGFNTTFRSYGTGQEPGKTAATAAFQLESYNRFYNAIGNVLGVLGFNTTYQTSLGTGAHNVVYDLGSGNSNGTVTVASDPLTTSTLFRWGNWDSATNTVRNVASEVPSGIGPPYANSVPASTTLPSSFFYASKPSYFNSTDVYPPIGSDLTPMVGVIPANRCYNTISGGADPNGTGGPYTFSAASCYTAATPVPGVPTNLTATPNNSTANLSWTAASGTVLGYSVGRSTTSGGPYTTIAGNVTTTSYADTNLAGGTYYYVVSAFNSSGSSANSTQASVTIQQQVSIPGVPTNLTATPNGSLVNLSWTASTGTPAGYKVSRSTSSGGPYTLLATLGLVTVYTDSGLTDGTYYYVVSAFNSAGTSANSAQASATVVLPQPGATVTPSTVNFAPQTVGVTTTVPLQFSIINTGTANLTSIVVHAPSGSAAADYAIATDNCTGTTLTPNGTCNVLVNFTPSATGSRQAAISIDSNDPASPDSVILQGTGVGAVAFVCGTQNPCASINFGNQYLRKATANQVVNVTNNSGVTMTFNAIALTTHTQYAIDGTVVGRCVVGTLATGSSCTINLIFTPTSNGVKTDTLTVTFTGAAGSPQVISLTGKGTNRKVLKVDSRFRLPEDRFYSVAVLIWAWQRRNYLVPMDGAARL